MNGFACLLCVCLRGAELAAGPSSCEEERLPPLKQQAAFTSRETGQPNPGLPWLQSHQPK